MKNLRRYASVLSLLFCFLISSVGSAASIFDATLTGDQEVPPVTTNAIGNATFIFDDTAETLTYQIDVFGLDIGGIKTPGDTTDDITGVHIHSAPAGTNGPVVFGIHVPRHDQNDRFVTVNGPSGLVRFSGIWDADDVTNGASSLASQLAALEAGELYVNVHTTTYPGGEIRGQIVPEPSSLAMAGLALMALMASGLRRKNS